METIKDIIKPFYNKLGLVLFDEGILAGGFSERVESDCKRYGGVVELLFALRTLKPSVLRFVLGCEALRKCFAMACREPFDNKIESCSWFPIGFRLLTDHPHSEMDDDDDYFKFNDVEQKLMTDAVAPLMAAMGKWAKRMQPDDGWGDTRSLQGYIDSILVKSIFSEDGITPNFSARRPEEVIFCREDDSVEFDPTLLKGMMAYADRALPSSPDEIVIKDESLSAVIDRIKQVGDPYGLKFYAERIRPVFERAQLEAKFSETVAPNDGFGLKKLVEEMRNAKAGDPFGGIITEDALKDFERRVKDGAAKRAATVPKASNPAEPSKDGGQSMMPVILSVSTPQRKNALDDALNSLEHLKKCEDDGHESGFTALVRATESLVRACLQRRQWGVFGNPLYVWAVTRIQGCGGYDCEIGTEDHSAESAWKMLANTMSTYFRFFVKNADGHELPDFGRWLQQHQRATYACEDTPRAPAASNYRGISSDICNGLFDFSKQIALESYVFPDDTELMYAGVFHDGIDMRAMPQIVEKNYSIEKCSEDLRLNAFVIPLDNDNPFDAYKATCDTMVKGLTYANQASDFKLPYREWFRSILEELASNPKGEPTFKNQDATVFDREEARWIVAQFYPVGRMLCDWANAARNHGLTIPLAEQILQDTNAYTQEIGDGEWDINWWDMMFTESYTPNKMQVWVFRPTVLMCWISKLPLVCPAAKMVELKTRTDNNNPAASTAPVEKTAPTNVTIPAPTPAPAVEQESVEVDDAWTAFYGKTILWYKISKDGRMIADLSDPCVENEYGYTVYAGITDGATLVRESLAFFFGVMQKEVICDKDFNVQKKHSFRKFPQGTKSKNSFRQMDKGGSCCSVKDLFDNLFEPEDDRKDENGRLINHSGKWRIYCLTNNSEVTPTQKTIAEFEREHPEF